MPAARYIRPLSEKELAALRARYRATHDADVRSRCQMILFSAQGKSVSEVAELTLFGEDTVLYWFERYEQQQLSGLEDESRSGRPSKSHLVL
jgi:transposase